MLTQVSLDADINNLPGRNMYCWELLVFHRLLLPQLLQKILHHLQEGRMRKGIKQCHTFPYMSHLKAKIKGPVFKKLSVINL